MNCERIPFCGADESRRAVMKILERADPGIVDFSGDPVVPLLQECGKIRFIEWPGFLITAGGSPADIASVHIKPVELIRTDEKKRLSRNGIQLEITAELRMAVVQ